MEERAREEMFRMKMIKKVKLRKQSQSVCPICKLKKDPSKNKEDEIKNQHELVTKTAKGVTDSCCKSIVEKKTPSTVSIARSGTESVKKLTFDLQRKVDTQTFLPEKCISLVESPIVCQEIIPGQKSTYDSKLESLKKLLAEIITMGKDVVHTCLSQIDIEKFLITCEDAKIRIDSFLFSENKSDTEIDTSLKERLSQLKGYLKTVIELTSELRDDVKMIDNAQCSIMCSNKAIEGDSTLKSNNTEHTSEQNQFCQGHSEKDNEPSLTPSICASARQKSSPTDICKTDYKENSLDKLTICCKNFKEKLKAYKSNLKPHLVLSSDSSMLVKKNVENENLRKVKKTECSVCENVNDLIECCDKIKELFQYNESENFRDVNEIYINIENAVALLKDLKLEALSDSLSELLEYYNTKQETPLKCCHQKSNETLFEGYCSCSSQLISVKDTSTECNIPDESLNSLPVVPCKTCRETHNDSENMEQFCNKYFLVSGKHNSARGLKQESSEKEYDNVKKRNISLCNKNCLGLGICGSNEEQDLPKEQMESGKNLSSDDQRKHLINDQSSNKSHISSNYSEISHKTITPVRMESTSQNSHEDFLGLYEKRIKKIVRVTRTMNEDGSIREETETTIIKKSRHDPTVTTLTDEPENDIDNASFENNINDNNNNTNTNVLRANFNCNRLEFLRKVKSEGTFKFTPMAQPILRQCISVTGLHKDDSIQE
ncbi:unnamed protein product [Diatraea saccharalis]|uniref:Uncharacterized protein n=1 Tax=Diatraea saccharalis TaxID=40085 RepID=A0A9N9WIS1_9NEOP|nr:unnamed protein product [Diatraea saccharalis]